MTLTAQAAARRLTVPGRPSNDGVILTERVFGVADGIDDGEASGERALLELVRILGRRPRPRDLRAALHAADVSLWCRDSATDRLVATVTLAVWSRATVAIGHIGDSRAYLVRDGRVVQLTTDHVTDDTDDTSVTRLGDRSGRHTPEVRVVRAHDGDRFVLCTDGLWRSLRDPDLIKVGRLDPSQGCAALAEAAGRTDEEASVVVVSFNDDGDERW